MQGYVEEYAKHVFDFYDDLLNRVLAPDERRLIGGSIFYVEVDKERKVMDLREKPFYFYPLGLLHVGGIKGDYFVFYADYKDVLELSRTATEEEPLEVLLGKRAFKQLFLAIEAAKQGTVNLDGFVGWTALVGIGLYGDKDQRVVVLVDGGQGMHPEYIPYEIFRWKRVGSEDWKTNLKAIWEKNNTLSVAFSLFIKQNAEHLLKDKIEYLPYGLLVTTSQTKDKSHWRLHTPIVEAPLKVTEDMQVNVLGGWGA